MCLLDALVLTGPSTDNTNRDRDARAHWVKVARDFKIRIRCILFTASARLAEHNDMVRALNGEVSLLPQVSGKFFIDCQLNVIDR